MSLIAVLRRNRWIAGIAVISLLMPLAQESVASKSYRERTSTLAPGVSYTRIRDRSGPFRIRIVSIQMSEATTIDTVLSNDKLPKFENTTSMAQRTGAIAAINGDYARSSGRPVYTFAADGYLAQTPLDWGRNFSVTYDETASYIGHPEVTGWATEADGGATYPISMVNNIYTPLFSTEVRLFTAQAGKDALPPSGHCLVRLMPLETPSLMTEAAGVEQSFQVDQVRCDGTRIRPMGGVVLASTLDSQYALAFQGLFPGEELSIGWSMGWPSVLDTIGGNPTLIEAGQIVSKNVDGSGSFFIRHPRTGVGTTSDGRVLFVTVDGRQPEYSVGMTLREFAELFQSLGADWALNLDGGGSTTMVINGQMVNRPSDKLDDGTRVERPVSSALVLLPGADYGEGPQPTPSPSPTSLLSYSGTELAKTISLDPASTGGMLDAMARRGHNLSAALLKMLRVFRSGR